MKSTIALCLMMIVGVGWGQTPLCYPKINCRDVKNITEDERRIAETWNIQWDEGLEPIGLWGYPSIHEYPERTWQTNFDMRCGFLYHDPCPIRFNFDVFMAPGWASWEGPNLILAERNPIKHHKPHIVCTSHTHHSPRCTKGSK